MSRCRHCELPVPRAGDDFCCRGCERVYALLHEEGLARYYDLRSGPGVAVDEDAPEVGRGGEWVDRVQGTGDAIELDVQGIHCAACVWLLESLYERYGSGELEVSSALGRARLQPQPGDDVRGFVADVERFGYRLTPAGEARASASDGLLLRVGICAALAGNGMMYALATYFGLDDGPVHVFFAQLGLAAATLSVLVGGSHFIGRAWRALRAGQISLDLPIALGILLAYGGALFSYFVRGEPRYADSLSIFVALMIAGRWLRERALERDRARASSMDGAEHLSALRLEGGRRERVGVRAVGEGDRLWLDRGALVPADAVLEEGPARFRLDWIDGEAEPRLFDTGETVPAGAFHLEGRPRVVRATQFFEESSLSRLLTRPVHRRRGASAFWSRASLILVALVIGAATAGGLGWLALAGPISALEVATAILIVSCPCAFGLAAPMAYELAAARLRQRGLFVREPDLFDRALGVRRVVVDKTGTLTSGSPRLVDSSALDALDPARARTLATLAAASAHPKARALCEALAERLIVPDLAARPEEVLGRGVRLVLPGGREARLGAPAWVVGAGAAERVDLAFADGEAPLFFEVDERIRADAAAELDRLRSRGIQVTILSGDRRARVDAVAEALRIHEAHGELAPDEKAAWLEAHEPEATLFLGDGLNDGPAAAVAEVSGCAALDRPFLAARTDFFVTGAGLAPLAALLDTAGRLRRSLRAVYAFALVYNVGAVAIAAAGWMSPWLAAIIMPLSSLSTLAYVGWRLGARELSAPEPAGAREASAGPDPSLPLPLPTR